MATNLLKFCMAGNDGLDLALGAGAACVGSMYTGSRLFWGWGSGTWIKIYEV